MYIYLPSHPNATKQGYVCEHRLVIENEVKKYLLKTEVVHHIDENRLNNSPSNLMLIENQAEHNKKHKMKRDAKGRFQKRGD